MLTTTEIRAVKDFITAHHDIFNAPTATRNIKIVSDKITMFDGMDVIAERVLDIKTISDDMMKIPYQKNSFAVDNEFNPLEADRKNYYAYWNKKYTRINVPFFMSVALASLLVLGKIPDIIDFAKIYMLTYTTTVRESINDGSVYGVPFRPRKMLGESVFAEGSKITNKLIKFNKLAMNYVSGLPINEFTTFDICSRIYKVYGSVIRDISNPIRIGQFTENVEYGFYEDLEGIDMMVNNTPVFVFVRSDAGLEFRVKKMLARHPHLSQNGVAFTIQIPWGCKGMYLPSNEFLHNMVEDMTNNPVEEYREYNY